MFVFNIHKHYKESPKTDKILENQYLIIQNQEKIMALIDDLKQEVTDLKAAQADLQTSVDLEQSQIAALLATNAEVQQTLNDKIAALEAEKANSPSPEAIQAVIDGLKEVKTALVTTKEDIETTV